MTENVLLILIDLLGSPKWCTFRSRMQFIRTKQESATNIGWIPHLRSGKVGKCVILSEETRSSEFISNEISRRPEMKRYISRWTVVRTRVLNNSALLRYVSISHDRYLFSVETRRYIPFSHLWSLESLVSRWWPSIGNSQISTDYFVFEFLKLSQ